MKKIDNSKIVLAAGIVIFAIATWFAFRTPTLAPLPNGTAIATTTPSLPSSSSNTSPSGLPRITSNATASKRPALTVINFISPSAGIEWSIGKQNTITWNKAAGVTGQMYLINANNGTIAGWIQQSIGPAQTYFPWNTRDLFLSETDPQGKTVLPGEYRIKMTFNSPQVPAVTSAPFFVVAATTTVTAE